MSEMVKMVLDVVKVMSDAEKAELIKALEGEGSLNEFVKTAATPYTERKASGALIWKKRVDAVDYEGKENAYSVDGPWLNEKDMQALGAGALVLLGNKATHEYAVFQKRSDRYGAGNVHWSGGKVTEVPDSLFVTRTSDFREVMQVLKNLGAPQR
jgi:hypothetical protein